MNRSQMESFFLKHERKKTYNPTNFKKTTNKEKKLLLIFLKKLASSKDKIDIRYINLAVKLEKNFKKRFLSNIKIKRSL
tara:strand:- start:86 stop:322 length:237 start_codon:yes stop_codon:yes gene_type:complete